MKQYKSKLLIIFFTVLSGLVFSSCDEMFDYFWTTGTLEKKDTSYTEKGVIGKPFIVNELNIYPDATRYSSIEDFNFDGKESIILTVRGRNAIIHELWLSIEGTNVSLPFYDLTGGREFYDGDVTRFMNVVVDQMRRYGYVTINVDAENYDGISGIQLDIELFAEMKVYVKD